MSEGYRAPRVVKPHKIARQAGVEDAKTGHAERGGLWPPGVYGHADYVLGFYQGEPEDGVKSDGAVGGVAVPRPDDDRRG